MSAIALVLEYCRRRPGFSRAWLVRAGLILVVGLRVLLATAAAASPPDPTWISGFWDDDDFDDVVIQVGSLVSICDSSAAPVLSADGAIRTVLSPAVPAFVRVDRSSRHDRAPP